MGVYILKLSLHTLHDGSILRIICAKDLIKIPVWQGNRIIDHSHVAKIKNTVKNIQNLDFGFRIVSYNEVDAGGNNIRHSCLVDGQHRHRVLYDHFHENLCEPDFHVLVIEKEVKNESEIITYFKELNNQLPIQWKSDPQMVANEYIKALCVAFNTKKEQMIRSKTNRPYLSVDRLREKLVLSALKESPEEIQAFVSRVILWNQKSVAEWAVMALQAKKVMADMMKKAAEKKFMLALDPGMLWIGECL